MNRLYNYVTTSKKVLVRDDIASVLGESFCNINISVTTISKCVPELKAEKRHCVYSFDLDYPINEFDTLFRMIRFLFNAMTAYSYTGNKLLHLTIISIPNNLHSSLCACDDYRSIALCCSLCKLLDTLILDLYTECHFLG